MSASPRANDRASEQVVATAGDGVMPSGSGRPVWGCPKLERFPRISIVTPNYNYGHFLEATLRSVLDQNYPNLDYIVIDDGSVDDSMSVIRRYADRLTHWETGPNRGQYKAITHGFSKATGEIFGWVNSDDMYLPWTLWVVADIFERFPRINWISTLKTGFWDWEGICLGFHEHRGFARAAFLDGFNLPAIGNPKTFIPANKRRCIQQESTFWRRSLWEEAGGYVSHEYGSAGDFELWCRFYRHTELHGVDVPLAGFRFQNQQQTTQFEKYAGYCAPALDRLREGLHWSPSPVFKLAYALRTWDRPVLHRLKLDAIHYLGHRVRRRHTDRPDVSWLSETHKFR